MKARPWVWLLLVFALLATACGGEVDESADDGGETEAVDDAPAEDNETEADEPEPETEEDPGAAETEEGPNTYDDPRGGIFAEFQAGFDRGDHPFTQLDAFCVAHDAAADPQATDDGIEADSISIVHIRSRLEDAVNIGFGIPVGDVNEPIDLRGWELGDGPVIKATILVDADQAAYARHILGEVVDRPDGSVTATLDVRNIDAFRSFVLSFLEHAEILEPAELRTDFVEWLEAQR